MTPLDALKAALEAKREAYADGREIRRAGGAWWVAKDTETATARRLAALLTDDTIAALIATAEAAREVGIYIDQDYHNADEERVFGRLAIDLAPLVEEDTNVRG